MKAKLLSLAVVVVALAAPAQALASGGTGGAQAALQNATTAQAALGASVSNQNAVNANVPVSIAGGNVNAGPSSATQTSASTATTDVSNTAHTNQNQSLDQTLGSSGCQAGCGGAGGFQAGIQNAQTQQVAIGAAKSDQNAVNANVPVSIAGGNVNSGSSSATQNANSTATTDVSNDAKTHQDQTQNQNIGGSSCQLGCGGAGAYQAGLQNASTKQVAVGTSNSSQNAVNANVPVSIAGGDVNSGSSSANQNANSTATTDVSNDAKTHQDQTLNQNVGGSSCLAGCGGAGGFQAGIQDAQTQQFAVGGSKSDQNAVNGNAPVSIAGGDVNSGSSSANQNANSTATTDVSNDAKTHQDQTLNQNVGGSSCLAGCGGAGGFQLGVQKADTEQAALGVSYSNQNAVNGNAPVSIAGGDVNSGSSSANQNANSTATTDVSNDAKTHQDQTLNQNIGGSSCLAGCGGAGGFQLGVQKADTEQAALGVSYSNQNAVNGNAPVSIAGGDVNSGSSSANQNANSTATTDVSNDAKTHQNQQLNQGSGESCECSRYGSDSRREPKGCSVGSGGNGGSQIAGQFADTGQWAAGFAVSKQNAVNSNAPHSTAGQNVNGGSSSANQNANSTATTGVWNDAGTRQGQWNEMPPVVMP